MFPFTQCQCFDKRRGVYLVEKVSVFIKIRVLFWLEISALGVLFYFDNERMRPSKYPSAYPPLPTPPPPPPPGGTRRVGYVFTVTPVAGLIAISVCWTRTETNQAGAATERLPSLTHPTGEDLYATTICFPEQSP